MKTIISNLLLSLLLCSCNAVPGKFIRSTMGCYTPHTTGIDSIININGYYTCVIQEGKRGCVTDSVTGENLCYESIMFFTNGTCKFFYEGNEADMYNIEGWISRTTDKIAAKKQSWKKSSAWGSFNGIYTILEDTIKIISVPPPRISTTWVYSEKYFKIVNRTTLQFVKYRFWDIFNTEKTPPFKFIDPSEHNIARFKKLDLIPELKICWMLKKKWFWCDEQQYKAWKKEMKNNK